MQTHYHPLKLIDTRTGYTIANYQFDDTPEWWRWYREYLQSEEWQRKADRCKRLAGYKCERCGATGRVLHAHHNKEDYPDVYKRAGKERGSDLLAVCVDCHEAIHQKQM